MFSVRQVAIAMILTGVSLWVGSLAWSATRKLVPLDIPISLSRGHIRSAFNVNLDSRYLIEIVVSDTRSISNLDCVMWEGCKGAPATFKARWALSSNGRIDLTGNSEGDSFAWCSSLGMECRSVGAFRSDGGQSTIDLDVLSDTSVLDKGHPRLRIEADVDGYSRVIGTRGPLTVFSVMIVALAVILLMRASANEHADHPIRLGISANPSKMHYTAESHPTLRRKPIFDQLPSFGLCATLILAPFGAALCVLQGLTLFPAHGIWVLTSTRKLGPPGVGQMASPLVLRINEKDQWFLDGKLVSRDQFPGALRAALSRRPDWVVYLLADGDLEFQKPATAIDLIQGLHARVVIGAPREGKP